MKLKSKMHVQNNERTMDGRTPSHRIEIRETSSSPKIQKKVSTTPFVNNLAPSFSTNSGPIKACP